VHDEAWEALTDEERSVIDSLICLEDDREENQDTPWLRERVEQGQRAYIAELAGRGTGQIPDWSAGLVYVDGKGWQHST
jgi:hypothetical protein